MAIEWKEKALNLIPAGSIVFQEQEEALDIGIVLKGKIEQKNKGMNRILGAGAFLGVSDVVSGVFQSAYRVVEDASVFIFPITRKEELRMVLGVNKDYPGLMLSSTLQGVEYYSIIRRELAERFTAVLGCVKGQYERCAALAVRYGCAFPEFRFPDAPPSDTSAGQAAAGTPENAEEAVLQECLEAGKVPLDVLKSFFGACPSLAYREVVEAASAANRLQEDCVKSANGLEQIAEILTGGREGGLLEETGKLAVSVTAAGGDSRELSALYEEIEETAKNLVKFLEDKTGCGMILDAGIWERLRSRFKTGEGNEGTKAAGNVEEILRELNGSLDRLLEYGGMAAEKAGMFREYVRLFSSLKDKFAGDDMSRKLRRGLTELFYELYEAVFLRAYQEKSQNRIIRMFLDYGYLSETLLEKNQLVQLYHRQDKPLQEGDPIPVFTASEWLSAVYEKRRDPSKNEFDMDYFEDLRERKKSEHMTPEQEQAYLADPKSRLLFEMKNMFRYNSRIVSGQISTFVPFLHKDQLPGDISRLYQTKDVVRNAVRELTELDYTAFYREMLYVNEEKGIKKEYIQMEIFPDIILLPVFGSRGSMWQEITGRRRDSAGRFLFPAFSDAAAKEMLIPVLGRFRWELCRTVQGTVWNDIKVKSLTSEYSDYIQFYRKNKDLTEERKEKLKLQIQKGRNSTKEVFVMDYETWIRFESQGAMRLNKVVREILAMYCPFNRTIRQNLSKQVTYEDAMARFHREMFRKQKEYELRLRHIEGEQGEITPELKRTLEFYRDL